MLMGQQRMHILNRFLKMAPQAHRPSLSFNKNRNDTLHLTTERPDRKNLKAKFEKFYTSTNIYYFLLDIVRDHSSPILFFVTFAELSRLYFGCKLANFTRCMVPIISVKSVHCRYLAFK